MELLQEQNPIVINKKISWAFIPGALLELDRSYSIQYTSFCNNVEVQVHILQLQKKYNIDLNRFSLYLVRMLLQSHHKITKIIFFISQVLACITISFLLLFVGANLTEEIRDPVLTFQLAEDYKVVVLFFFLVLIAAAIIVSWFQINTGAYLMIAFTILACVFWGIKDFSMLTIFSPIILSALMLLFNVKYKDWLIKATKQNMHQGQL